MRRTPGILVVCSFVVFVSLSSFSWAQPQRPSKLLRIQALTTAMNAQIEIYKVKSDKTLRFREQMSTNILVFILIAVGGFVSQEPVSVGSYLNGAER